MREKLGEISIDRIKDKYKLPSIPDLFAVDDRGQAQAFRHSMNNNSYREYDKTYYQAHSAFFADLGLDRLFKQYLDIDELQNPHGQTVQELFFFLPIDTSVVRFRQDILRDFIAEEGLSQIIEEAIKTLKKGLSGIGFSATSRGLLLPYSRLLRDYEHVLNELIEKLGSKNSEGLRQLSQFLKKAKEYPDMKIWKDEDLEGL